MIPDSEKTKAIKRQTEEILKHIQDVSNEVGEIKKMLARRDGWLTAIIRALKQFLSHVDTNWKK